MSSSARAVFFGSPPGIFLLTKWITCSRTGGRPPVVAGGRCVCAGAEPAERPVAEALRLVAPVDHQLARQPDRLRVVGVQEEHRSRVAGIEALLAHASQQVAHRHRDVAEVDVDRAGRFALVADGAVIGDVAELVPVLDRDAAARLLLVQERLDQQRGREDLVARRIEQVGARHVRRADRLALAAAQAVLDRVARST